jgi:hypothetical protein
MATVKMFSQAEPKPNSSFPDSKIQLSASKDTEQVSLTPSQEEALLRRLDWRILPVITLLWLLAFLDRSNIGMKPICYVHGYISNAVFLIGNARVAGIVTDLKLVGLQYNTAAAIFFIPYILFEIPCNLLMKRFFKPAAWRAYLLLL